MRPSASGPPSSLVGATGTVFGVLVLVVLCAALYRRFRPAAPSNKLKGACLVLIVVCLWTGSSVVIQTLLEEKRFHRPYFVTYVSFSAQAVLLLRYPRRVREIAAILAAVCCCECARVCGPPRRPKAAERKSKAKYARLGKCVPSSAQSDSASNASTATKASSIDSASTSATSASGARAPPMPTTELLCASTRLCALLGVATLLFNICLAHASVSAATVLASTSSLWTLIFSVLRLGEKCSLTNSAAVALSLGGVALVVWASARAAEAGGHANSHAAHAHHVGRALAAHAAHQSAHASAPWIDASTWQSVQSSAVAMLSALLYGAYAVQLKLDLPSSGAPPISLVFGVIGLACLIVGAPMLFVLHLVHAERFVMPGPSEAGMLALNAALGTVLANVLLARAMQLASPLVATVGLSLSIPLAMASDVLRQRVRLTPTMVLGALAVWSGFLIVSGAKQLRRRMKLCRVCPGCVGVAPAPPAPRATALHRVTHTEAEP